MSPAQERPPCSQPTLSEIRFLEGAWRVQFRSRLSASPTDWENGVATATIDSLLRGCAFIERYPGTRDGHPLEAVRLFAATPGGSGLRVVLADSEHGPLFAFDGGPEGDGVAFYTQVTTPADPVRLRLRFQDSGRTTS